MKLSIIIPLYNAEAYIGACLDSILTQTVNHADYEIIIINDGSTDGSLAIAEDYSRRHPHILVYSQPNSGPSVARNRALDLARGEWVQFVDADDQLYPSTLHRLLALADDHPEARVVTFRFASAVESNPGQPIRTRLYADGRQYIASVNYSNGPWWYITRRQALADANLRFVPGTLVEDAMFTMRMLLTLDSVLDTDLVAYHYVIHPLGVIKSTDEAHRLKMIHSYMNAIQYMTALIDEHSPRLDPDCKRRCLTRRDSFTYFMLLRMMRSSMPIEAVASILHRLRDLGCYPIPSMALDYKELRHRVVRRILNARPLYLPLCRLARLARR